jgi:thiol-disulfide isomerase/thioredoxin
MIVSALEGTGLPYEAIPPGTLHAGADAAVTGRMMHFAFFHAPWCGVCCEKAPVVDDLASTYGLTVEHFDIDTDAGKAEYERRRLKQIPTLALVNGDRMPFRLVGAMITPENVDHLMRMHGPKTQQG